MHPGSWRPRHPGSAAARGGSSLIVASVLLSFGTSAATATDHDHGLSVSVHATPPSRPEPGGAFEFDVTVHNGSDGTVTLTALTDAIDGDLDGAGSCTTGGTIEAGDDYDCSFDASLTGDAGDARTEVVTATVSDDEGRTTSRSSHVTITLSDVPPTVELTKTVDRTRVAPGATVTFTVEVRNTSVEPVTLTELTDSIHGDLDGQGTCAAGGTIDQGASYACRFTVAIEKTETDVVTGIVADDDGGSASSSADATVAVYGLTLDKRNDAPIVSLVLPDGSRADLPTAPEGSTVDYTIEYDLTGDPLSDVVITDVVPLGLQYVKGSARSDDGFALTTFNASTGTLSWTAATIARSGTITYSAFVVDGASSLSQPLENVAAIVSAETDPTDDFSDVFVPADPLGETSPPKATPPATDAIGSEAPAAPGPGLAILLGLLVALVTGIGVAASTPRRRRRERR